MIRKKPRRDPSRAPGIAFEEAVADIQALFAGGECTVTHNERIIDRLGHRRQFDVVFRGKIAGHDVLGVLECKDLARALGPSEVEAFVTKSAAVRANVRAIVSRFGFSRKALDLCNHHGVRAMSLLKSSDDIRGVTVGDYAYLRRFSWDRVRWGARTFGGPPLIEGDPTRLG